MTDEPRTEYRRSALERFIGGSPLGVALRLVLLSLVVGFLMTIFGIRPQDIFDNALRVIEATFRDGFGVLRDVWAYVLTGAAVVVPVWFVLRLARAR